VEEKRWGDEWLPGMRVRVFNHYTEPHGMREGTITSRSWGRDKGKPIWRFSVAMDGIEGEWSFEPGHLLPPGT
jgi:hypothetical protein